MTAPSIKGVLFDMDDTLIDWSHFQGDWHTMERKHLRNVLEYLEEAGRPVHVNFDKFVDTYMHNVQDSWEVARGNLRSPHIGRTMVETLQSFGFEPDDEIDMWTLLQAYAWGGVDAVTLFEDVPPALEILIERGLKLGIVTNASQPMKLRDVELEKHGLMPYFPDAECRIAAADVGYLKPHPRIFEYALEKIELKAEETIYVGDNPVADVAGAQGAGMRAVLRIMSPSRTLISGLIIPDAAINTLAELPDLIDKWDAAETM